jgi:hypothetical protein
MQPMGHISYEQFGVNFVRRAVTTERLKEEVADLAGDSFHIGPMSVGPGGVAVAKADGTIGSPIVEELPGVDLRFEAKLPIVLNLEVRVAGVPQRYRGDIEVSLWMTVRTVEPLLLVIEVAPVEAGHVTVDLESGGMSAGVLQRVGNIDEEVRSQVVRVVNDRVNSDKARASREIDVAVMIDDARTASGNTSGF